MNLIKAISDNIYTELEETEVEIEKTANKLRDLTLHLAKLTAHQVVDKAFNNEFVEREINAVVNNRA